MIAVVVWPSISDTTFNGVPALVRYPGCVPAGGVSNEIVHMTDMFTTIIRWAGLEVPKDRASPDRSRRSDIQKHRQ